MGDNLKVKSFKRIVQEHDEHVRKIDLKSIPEIKVNKKYPKIESVDTKELSFKL